MKQMFKAGDMAVFHDKKFDYRVKVIEVNGEGDNDIWYEVEPQDIEQWAMVFHRTVPQSRLEKLGE